MYRWCTDGVQTPYLPFFLDTPFFPYLIFPVFVISDIRERDAYFHPISRTLIHRRYELEHELEVEDLKRDLFGVFTVNKFTVRMEAINMRINLRSSNTVTGYAVRATEELIAKKKTLPLSLEEIEKGINLFKKLHSEEYVVHVENFHYCSKKHPALDVHAYVMLLINRLGTRLTDKA